MDDALTTTQDEADAVVDVLLSVAEQDEWWKQEDVPTPKAFESESPWWLQPDTTVGASSNPFLCEPSAPQSGTPLSKPRISSTGGFQRMLSRSLARSKRCSAGKGSAERDRNRLSRTSILEDDGSGEEDEEVDKAIAQVLQAAPEPPPPQPSSEAAEVPSALSTKLSSAAPELEQKAVLDSLLVFSVERGHLSSTNALQAIRAIDAEVCHASSFLITAPQICCGAEGACDRQCSWATRTHVWCPHAACLVDL